MAVPSGAVSIKFEKDITNSQSVLPFYPNQSITELIRYPAGQNGSTHNDSPHCGRTPVTERGSSREFAATRR